MLLSAKAKQMSTAGKWILKLCLTCTLTRVLFSRWGFVIGVPCDIYQGSSSESSLLIERQRVLSFDEEIAETHVSLVFLKVLGKQTTV